MTDEIRAALVAGLRLGFAVTREGFNGECSFSHLAPDALTGVGDPLDEIEAVAIKAYAEGPEAFAALMESLSGRW